MTSAKILALGMDGKIKRIEAMASAIEEECSQIVAFNEELRREIESIRENVRAVLQVIEESRPSVP